MTKERAAKIILDMINGAESTLGHSLTTVEINALKKGYCALNPEPTTNADRIRAMTDEEIVVCMMKHDVMPTEVKKRLADGAFETRSDALLWWLKQECDDNGT